MSDRYLGIAESWCWENVDNKYPRCDTAIGVFACLQVQWTVPTNSREWPTWHLSLGTESIRLGIVRTFIRPSLRKAWLQWVRFVHTYGTQSNAIRTYRGSHVGHWRESVSVVYCTYGQAITANAGIIAAVSPSCRSRSADWTPEIQKALSLEVTWNF